MVVPWAQIALEAARYAAWRQARVSQLRLARGLEMGESEVWRMLNPGNNSKAATIDRARRQLEKRVTVAVGEAARPTSEPGDPLAAQ